MKDCIYESGNSETDGFMAINPAKVIREESASFIRGIVCRKIKKSQETVKKH